MTWIKNIIIGGALAIAASAQAQCHEMRHCDESSCGQRRITSVYSLEIGSARDLSTYLSPLYYDGIDIALSGSWTKPFQRWSDRCVMRFEGGVDFQSMKNPVRNALMYGLTGRFNWGLLWRHEFDRRWQMTLGPMIDIYGGALYSTRNGNNPVTAIASAGLDIAGSVSWNFRIGRLPISLVDEVRVPSMSAFFNPEYGETYYEIYLGNHSGLAHCGWWGNAAGVDNLLALRLNLGKTGLQIGYRFDLRTFRSNGLKTQVMRNAFVIGVIPNLSF